VYHFERWLDRFGFVKGIVAIHLMLWLGFIGSLNVLALVVGKFSMASLLFDLFTLIVYLLPITLGAIIMNWLIYGIQTFGENLRKPEKIKMILRSIRTLLACLHSLFRKVLFK
jgi:hypothetical protein